MQLNLFALSQDASRRVLRLPLAHDVQQVITDAFKQQESDFNNFVQQEMAFDGKYKPDDGECLLIKDYDDIDNIHAAIEFPLSIPEINPTKSEFFQIKALFSGYKSGSDKIALIQNFGRRKIISSSGLSIFHSSNVYRKVDGVGISLDTKLSAVLKNKTLRFFSFHNAKRVFDLSQYYVEATDKDCNEFAALDCIHIVDNGAFIALADNWIRRKISLISQSQILENYSAEDIAQSALAFGIAVKLEDVNGKNLISLPSEKADLKKY